MRIVGPRLDANTGAASSAGSPKAPRAATEGVLAGVESHIGSTQQPYLAKAIAVPAVRAEAVAEAKRLMDEGLLDTPEAIDRAAEGILADWTA